MIVGAVLRRRRSVDAPTQPVFSAPAQLDRADFAEADGALAGRGVLLGLVCRVRRRAEQGQGAWPAREVDVVEVEYPAAQALHRKYHIDAVPIVIVADSRGVVRASFVGPVSATDLWAAVAEARHPGSSPEPDLGR